MSLMTNMEIGHFINGLKVFLRNSPLTQEEFAEGVTSKVNLSNVLRGNSGTSEKMRRALAKKTGLSVKDLVNLGKSKNGEENGSETFTYPVIDRRQLPAMNLSHDKIASMGALEIMNHTAAVKSNLLDIVVQHNKQMTAIIAALTQQRDALMAMLDEHKAIVNVLEQPMISVNRAREIQDCNRIACEDLGIFPGNKYTEAQEAIERVFITGRKEYMMIAKRQAALYPVFDSVGNVKQVVVALRGVNANQEHPIGLSG